MTLIDRATWDNSPFLRAAVAQRLRDWGWHSFGGEDHLGYPNHTAFADPPAPEYQNYSPEHGPDDAAVVEHMISTAAQASLHSMVCAQLLRMEYTRPDLTQKERARRLGYKSRRTYYRRLGDAQFWFCRLAVVLEEAAEERLRMA